MFQKFVKTKQNEVKLFKILQDRSKTNVFVSNCVKEKKQNFVFWGKKAKKNEYNRSSTIEDLSLLYRSRYYYCVLAIPSPIYKPMGGGGGGGGCRTFSLSQQKNFLVRSQKPNSFESSQTWMCGFLSGFPPFSFTVYNNTV